MQRTRVNGTKFQNELADAAEKLEVPVKVVRLRTPQSQQANVRNIADFILYGRTSIILEVKETGEKSFSLHTFQQHEEVEKFQEFFDKAKSYYKWADYPYRCAVLVHFMRQGKFTLYYVDENPFKVMHPDDDDCITLDNLKDMITYIVTR